MNNKTSFIAYCILYLFFGYGLGEFLGNIIDNFVLFIIIGLSIVCFVWKYTLFVRGIK